MFEILNISSNDAVIDDQKLLPPLHLSFINEPQNELILKSIFHKTFLVVKMKMYVNSYYFSDYSESIWERFWFWSEWSCIVAEKYFPAFHSVPSSCWNILRRLNSTLSTMVLYLHSSWSWHHNTVWVSVVLKIWSSGQCWSVSCHQALVSISLSQRSHLPTPARNYLTRLVRKYLSEMRSS